VTQTQPKVVGLSKSYILGQSHRPSGPDPSQTAAKFQDWPASPGGSRVEVRREVKHKKPKKMVFNNPMKPTAYLESDEEV
jgi:hypothetical protein